MEVDSLSFASLMEPWRPGGLMERLIMGRILLCSVFSKFSNELTKESRSFRSSRLKVYPIQFTSLFLSLRCLDFSTSQGSTSSNLSKLDVSISLFSSGMLGAVVLRMFFQSTPKKNGWHFISYTPLMPRRSFGSAIRRRIRSIA